ncbi:alpha-ketoacid dehydrogenase subunit beta [Thermodesulfitimonas autotrophica]|uniref:alpha-ketoacid dehydrogenase subunit beta n=1 Tax=Thermodesulfitimonas autotrophica TaxID=1894989 RepID=UPI002FE379F2
MPWTKLVADKHPHQLPDFYATGEGRQLTYREAIREALDQAMALDPKVIILGQGVNTPGYIYGTTSGLSAKFGKERVIETPVAEAAMTGITLGMAVAGLRPVLVHMRNDFLLVSMDQILNHIAHWQRLFRGPVPLVIRTIIARGWGSGAQHAQSLQALFAGLDGLEVVMPATPYDVKGLFLSAVAAPKPVLFFEHRWLYEEKGYVPAEPYLLPLGTAALRAEGKDLTVVAVSLANRDVGLALAELVRDGITADWIDLRSVNPLDMETICRSVQKTGRLLVVENGPVNCGVGAEIATRVTAACWDALRAPVARIGWPGTTVPAGPKLEERFYPSVADVCKSIVRLVKEDGRRTLCVRRSQIGLASR